MPRLSQNPTTELRRGREYDIGSLPVASVFEVWDTADQLRVKGYVKEIHPWGGGATVVLFAETDANFSGSMEGGTLARVDAMGQHRWQERTPVVWLGVSDELKAELAVGSEQGSDDPDSSVSRIAPPRPACLIPAVDLTVSVEAEDTVVAEIGEDDDGGDDSR